MTAVTGASAHVLADNQSVPPPLYGQHSHPDRRTTLKHLDQGRLERTLNSELKLRLV